MITMIMTTTKHPSPVGRRGRRKISAFHGPSLAAIGVSLVLLTGCGATPTSQGASTDEGLTSDTFDSATLKAVAAFYPLQFILERVGGEHVTITSLAPPGGHSHDLELGPGQVVQIEESDLVVLIPGFMPALDQAVESQKSISIVNAAASIDMIEGSGHSHDHDHDHGESHGSTQDPHIWLDPTNMAAIAVEVKDRLSELDPKNADQYARNAAEVRKDLERLDNEWMSGTINCQVRDLIVAHEAFGYLAKRYRFNQRGISGISPEAEPSPKKIAEIMNYVRDRGVQTIYYESLIDPRVAETIAAETGARTAKLDPIESRSDGSSEDYLSIMRANLETLRAGNGCV